MPTRGGSIFTFSLLWGRLVPFPLSVAPLGWWIGHWKTTWSTIWSSSPHSQTTEAAILHLCKQEPKRLTPVRRRLSRTHAVLSRAIPGVLVGDESTESRSPLQPFWWYKWKSRLCFVHFYHAYSLSLAYVRHFLNHTIAFWHPFALVQRRRQPPIGTARAANN